MTNAHINYPHNLLWLNSYLIYLSFLGRDSFLSLFLKNLLPLLYIFIRGHRERVVELIIAFVHHVPISVGLLQTIRTQLGMSKQTPLSPTHEWHQVDHSLFGLLPTAPSHLHYQTGFLPHHHLSLLKTTTFWTHTLIKNRNMLAFSRKQGAPYSQRPTQHWEGWKTEMCQTLTSHIFTVVVWFLRLYLFLVTSEVWIPNAFCRWPTRCTCMTG